MNEYFELKPRPQEWKSIGRCYCCSQHVDGHWQGAIQPTATTDQREWEHIIKKCAAGHSHSIIKINGAAIHFSCLIKLFPLYAEIEGIDGRKLYEKLPEILELFKLDPKTLFNLCRAGIITEQQYWAGIAISNMAKELLKKCKEYVKRKVA